MSIGSMLDWITVRGYKKATREATKRIISKQSRGSVSAQNGHVMSHRDLDQQSQAADKSFRRIKDAVSRA